MAELPEGYTAVAPEDQKKARAFFDRGRTVAETGNYDYAIELYLQGLALDPEAVDAHKELRDISMRRKASGGKDLGMFEKMRFKRPTKDDKQNILHAEKLLAYDPGNTDLMVSILQNAHRAGYYATVLWIGPILQKANAEGKSPSKEKFIVLRDIYRSLKQWKLATDACHFALRMDPEDMELQTDLKNLGAQQTMEDGSYDPAESFIQNLRDPEKQQELLDREKGVESEDSLTRGIRKAEADWKVDPNDPVRVRRLVEALIKTEQADYENRAIELLDVQYKATRQFSFRHSLGRIKLAQLSRMERSLREAVKANPDDSALQRDLEQFQKERWEEELKEYKLWAGNYPTDLGHRYQMALRLFFLKRYDEAIPELQRARDDPKYRNDAAIHLARAFLEAGYIDEATDTLRVLVEEYQIRGDERSKVMYYWYGRALEQKKEMPAAIKCYSQVAQWDFNYLDVQPRVKALRALRQQQQQPEG